ncbi:hypothetical protein WMZ97_07775 [Lentibacillus sp. N15]|uniref:hypothetical protein n=1 Tax=Lentibacillus songyuanensis TaxID=3136161 RepID=UPI0031B9C148
MSLVVHFVGCNQLVKDCTRATSHDNYLGTLEMTTTQGGMFGTVVRWKDWFLLHTETVFKT